MRRAVLLVGALVAAGCGDGDGDDAPVAGCDGLDAARLRGDARATARLGGDDLVTGYVQASADNQDPYVARLAGDDVVWCDVPSTAPPDERGEVVAVDAAGRVWVAMTTDGGNTDLRATAGAFQGSYGRGGGPKASWLARLDPDTGAVLAATFLHATRLDGDTNTMVVTAIAGGADDVTVDADAYYTPPPFDPAGGCAGDSPFAWVGVLDLELTTLISATAPGCTR